MIDNEEELLWLGSKEHVARIMEKVDAMELNMDNPSRLDNSLASVLFRRLAADLRAPSGWTTEEFETYVRETVYRTLLECGAWFSVDDRLPPPGIEVAVLVNGQRDIGYVGVEDHAAGWFWELRTVIASDEQVTHWMPLHEPPQ